MKKKRTVFIVTLILVIAFALSSVGVTFIEPEKKESFPLVLVENKEVFSTEDFKKYARIYSNAELVEEESDVRHFVLDFVTQVEALKVLGFRGSSLLASQFYASQFKDANFEYVLLRLGTTKEIFERALLDHSLMTSVERLFQDLGLFDGYLSKAVNGLFVRYSGKDFFFKIGDIPVPGPDEAEVETYYEENLNQFMTIPLAQIALGQVDLSRLHQKFPVSENDLEEFYMLNKERFKEDDRVLCEMYNFKIEDEGTARVLNKASLEDFKKDLERLDLKHSVGSRWFSETEFKATFEDTPKGNEFYGPQMFPTGPGICFVKEITKGLYPDYVSIKNKVLLEYTKDETTKLLKDVASDVPRGEVMSVMGQYGLMVEQNFEQKDEYFLKNISKGMAKMEPGLYFFLEDEKLKFVYVREVYPSRPLQLDEVRDRIVKVLVSQKQRKLVLDLVNALANKKITNQEELKNVETQLRALKPLEETFTRKTIFDYGLLFDIKPKVGLYGPFENEGIVTAVLITDVEIPKQDEQVGGIQNIEELKTTLRSKLNNLPLKEIVELVKRHKIEVVSENLSRYE
ncbi:MAG: peptidylprolyl isomerase [Deltaproteobacteria bacterium]|nr:peptidylprolyl isomerase [Deltaproteobacteria bacterium]